MCSTSCSSALPESPDCLELGAHLRLGLAEGERLGLREAVGDELGVMVAELLVRLGGDQEIRRARSRCPGAGAGRRRAGRWCRARPRRSGRCGTRRAASRASPACRSIPCRAAADARRSARAAGRRGAPHACGSPSTLRYQTPSSPMMTGMFSASGALRKCSSIACAPARKSRKFSRADRDGERQADRRPHRIAAADPVPEAEDAVGPDAELGDLLEVGGDARRNGRRPPPRRSR